MGEDRSIRIENVCLKRDDLQVPDNATALQHLYARNLLMVGCEQLEQRIPCLADSHLQLGLLLLSLGSRFTHGIGGNVPISSMMSPLIVQELAV